MKTQRQRINAAREKVQKISEKIDTLAGKLQDICEDLEDEELCERITAVTDVLNDMLVGNSDASFLAIYDYMDEYAEKSSDCDDDDCDEE